MGWLFPATETVLRRTPEYLFGKYYILVQGRTNLKKTNKQKQNKRHLKILRARMMTWNKFHIKDPQILGVSLTKFIRLGFLQPPFVLS
jgi:hypothetical protein